MFSIVGLNHLKSSVEQRGQLHFSEQEAETCLKDIIRQQLATEACILSTCNRTEIYYVSDNKTALHHWLMQYRQITSPSFTVYLSHDQAAIRHSFLVASGLDSMAIGETQILSQMKRAIQISQAAGAYGDTLQFIFEKAFSCAKAIRTQTGISRHHVSIPSACLQIAMNIFHDFREHHILFIGAGEMIRLCLTYFAHRNPRSLTVMNRTIENALHIVKNYRATVYPLSTLAEHVHKYDIIVTSTGAHQTIITEELFHAAMKKRRYRPVLVFDLAVPRDTEASLARRSDTFLYTIDDLAVITQSGMDHRREEIQKAEKLIDTHLTNLDRALQEKERGKTIRLFRAHIMAIQQKEITHARQLIKNGRTEEEVITILAHRLTQKFLHTPSVAIRHSEEFERYITELWQL